MSEVIHKFNSGNKATLCNDCRTIVSTDFTEEIYCKECNNYRQEIERAIRTTLVVLNKHSINIAVDKIVKLKENG